MMGTKHQLSQKSGRERFLEPLLPANSLLLHKRNELEEEGERREEEEGDQGIRRNLKGTPSPPNPGMMPSEQLLQRATYQTSHDFTPGGMNPQGLRGQPQTPPHICREHVRAGSSPGDQLPPPPLAGGDGKAGGEGEGLG